jgi:uncharacterized protein YdeI (YjbR/CyaY-like superfamily)
MPAKSTPLADLEHVELRTRAEWRAWLTAHHARSPGIWLVYFKKASGQGTLTYPELVQEALCFGWIDSKPNKVDDTRSKILVTPRKPTSNWSGVNKRYVEQLLAEGLMTPAGQRAIDAARANGNWDALTEVDALTLPSDLLEAFAKAKRAQAFFEGEPKSYRRGVLEWLLSAKTPATRLKRLTEIVEQSKLGQRANQWVRKS